MQVRTRCSRDKLRAHGLIIASLEKYDTPPGIPPPPSHERTRRWEPGLASRSRSQSPNLRSSHSHSYPPSVRDWNMRPERSPSLSHDSRRPNGSHDPTEIPHVHDSIVSCRSRSRTCVKGKGKRRASARSLSPPESDIWYGSPVSRHERTGSSEVSVAPMSSASCTPTGDPGEVSPLVPQTLESNSGGTVVSPHLDGNPSTPYTTHSTDNHPPPLGLRSLNHEIIASSSSKSETPELLTINTNRVRVNPMRQPRYRSQRDSIVAHLRGSVVTPRRTPSLLARMTDRTVAKVSGSDADIVKRAGGKGHVPRTAERSSGLSNSDDPSGRRNPKETAVTKYGARLLQIRTSCLATRALMSILHTC